MSRGLIVLDPGHGEKNNAYPKMPGRFEGTQNFRLSVHLKRELEARGFTVLTTREEIGDDPSLEERGRLAGENHALLFLSLHSNAPGPATTPEAYEAVCGSETYYSITDEARNIPIARALNDAVVQVMQTEDRGIKTRSYPNRPDVDYYGVIRASAQSGCKQAFLIEHGFHTNPHDSAFLTDETCLARLAAAEADVLDKLL